ncbi:MAG: hypothetical protein JWQ56_410, partial [Pseudarthrobacter sp.]|nr:hypothetical protein [Pseudarthrobacter sp.]
LAKTDLAFSPTALFLSSFVFNLLISLVLFVVLGGRGLLSTKVSHYVEQADEARMAVSVGAKAGSDVPFKGFGSGMYGPGIPQATASRQPKSAPRGSPSWSPSPA